MQTKSSTKKSNIMGRLVDEMVTSVSGQFRGVDSPPEQTKEHSGKQTHGRTDGRTDERTHGQTVGQTVGRSDRRTDRQSNRQTAEHTEGQTKGQSNGQSEEHTEEQSAVRDSSATCVLTALDRSAPPFIHFTERQSTVLAFMIHSKNKYVTLDYIAYATGLTFASVRTIINALHRYKYVLTTGRFQHLKTQCLHYELDEIRCEQFWKEKGVFYDFSRPLSWNGNVLNRPSEIKSIEQTKEQTEGQSEAHTEGHTEEQTHGRTDGRTDIYSSSIVFNNNLLLTEITKIFETHPDFAFWIEEKLEPETVLRWIEEFRDIPIKVEDMLLYLSRCSYHLTTLNKKASLKNTPVNYFYGCIKRNKTYLLPPGFKTLEERILEDKRKIVEELENRARELQELEERQRQANIEIKFHEMMGEETGELYKACFNNIPAMFRSSDRSGPGFKTAMKQALMRIPNSCS